MLAFLAAPLLAGSAFAMALEPRAAPTESPGAVGFEYPPLRGWAQSAASESPCGGFSRQGTFKYPLSGSDISLKLLRDVYNVQVKYAPGEATADNDFQTYTSAREHVYSGNQCFESPNFASLGMQAGDTVTLQVSGQTGPKRTTVYQCADIVLVADDQFVQTETYTCRNFTASTQTRGDQNPSSSAVSASSNSGSSNDQPVSPVGAGFIGAAVAVVLCAVLVAGAYFAGVAKFGSRSKLAALPTANSARHDEIPAYDAASMTSRGSMVKA
ncbi:copper acquisition factor BIM1-like domain-containing protein [Rhodotorula paludigena]|uniref:copper acquisition factor BIM1-like domain-containing protein n=1 Tax=Rhodotorula paludigena TaxID=86838 RepID=UPI00316BC6EF